MNLFSELKNCNLFTCKKCGSHDVLVSCLYSIQEVHQRILPCQCSISPSGRAATQTLFHEKRYEDYGYLDQKHQWEFIKKNSLIDRTEKDTDFLLECGKCFILYEIETRKWIVTLEKRELLEDSVEFHVSCGGCGEEIEFGWSQPDRAGKIWPVECIDFVPEKVWPEPRFRERWSQKGWVKPDQLFETFSSETKIRSFFRKIVLKRIS